MLEVLESGQLAQGSRTAAFEGAFAAYVGASHAIAVNSGTAALIVAMQAHGIGPGDEVITTPFSFIASATSIIACGATPVFADIDPYDLNLDPEKAEAAITPRTKAVMPVHLFGHPARVEEFTDLCEEYGLALIEDACQAHGAEWDGRRVGGIGDLGAFSFYPGKNLGAYGEGGMVTTSNAGFARKIRMLRDWGAEKKYEHVLKGYNMRLEGMQGAILRVKLRHLERWTEARRAAARRYDALLAGSGVPTPYVQPGVRHVYHIYSTRTSDRARWQAELSAKGVQTGIHYPIAIHMLPAYEDLGYGPGAFPHAERAAAEQLSLPMYPELTPEMQAEVAAAVIALHKAAELAR